MQLSSSDIHQAYQPTRCDLRLFLKHQGAKAAKPGPFEDVIRRLGERYEKAHLKIFNNVVDVSAGTPQYRKQRTLDAINERAAVIYQGVFSTNIRLGGRDCEVTGIPDFLVFESGNYIIRDVKMARRVNKTDHPEILSQLRLYGLLFELTNGMPPTCLEVYSGAGEVITIEPAAADEVEQELSNYLGIMQSQTPPFAPVGWTKCGGCGYRGHCWTNAEKARDVALVPKIDQNLAQALHDLKIFSYDDLLNEFDAIKLAAVQKPWGQKTQKVGKAAADILRSALAIQSNRDIPIAKPILPDSENFVMFDLEGLPPHLDELEKIYLWGMQVYGAKPSAFMAATADFGPEGDRTGWETFLKMAADILEMHDNIPFVHWHHYERTKLDAYINRYGDSNGIASTVRANLFDLLPATQKAVALPLPSYSLKVVERHVGFKRSQTEYGGEWSMAQYIEATETHDESIRQAVMADILKYNEEDLAATWAVLRWLQEFGQRM